MTREARILTLRNRIHLLNQRSADNGRVVRKLERQLRKLENS